ncbi:MAG: hypothetical protein DSY58_01145, partial [Desulfobulbus sp.]
MCIGSSSITLKKAPLNGLIETATGDAGEFLFLQSGSGPGLKPDCRITAVTEQGGKLYRRPVIFI